MEELRLSKEKMNGPQSENRSMSPNDAQKYSRVVYNHSMRTKSISMRVGAQGTKLTRLKTKRQIVDKALELLVRSESRKGILRYYGSGIGKGISKPCGEIVF